MSEPNSDKKFSLQFVEDQFKFWGMLRAADSDFRKEWADVLAELAADNFMISYASGHIKGYLGTGVKIIDSLIEHGYSLEDALVMVSVNEEDYYGIKNDGTVRYFEKNHKKFYTYYAEYIAENKEELENQKKIINRKVKNRMLTIAAKTAAKLQDAGFSRDDSLKIVWINNEQYEKYRNEDENAELPPDEKVDDYIVDFIEEKIEGWSKTFAFRVIEGLVEKEYPLEDALKFTGISEEEYYSQTKSA